MSAGFTAASLWLVSDGRVAEQTVATVERDEIVERQEFVAANELEDGARVGVGHEESVGGITHAMVAAGEKSRA